MCGRLVRHRLGGAVGPPPSRPGECHAGPVDSPLISPEALAARLDDVTVLDVRWRLGGPPGAEEHAAGHIPGAAYVDLDTDLADPPETDPGGRGRHPLPGPDRLQAALRAAGVEAGRPVVAYDDWGGRAAARLWWLLRWAGHGDVRVLDGGWSAWREAGGAVETGPTTPVPGSFEVRADSVPTAAAQDLPGYPALIDARAPERYRGDTEPMDPVAGHVPGAVNRPTDLNLDETGRFRGPEELRAVYAGLEGAAVYCGSGVTACHDLLAMRVAGMEAVLYPDSWSGWVTDTARPVETGDEPTEG